MYIKSYRDDLQSKYGVKNDRLCVMNTISDLINGDSLHHYINRFVMSSTSSKWCNEDREQNKKRFVSFNPMDRVIKLFVSFCPTLESEVISSANKKKLKYKQDVISEVLRTNKWVQKNQDIYDSLEKKGDAFFYIYFDNSEDKIPKIKMLKSENMVDIVLDVKGNPKAYIYKYREVVEKFNTQTCSVEVDTEFDVCLLFEIGKTTRIVNGTETTTLNRASYSDKFSIIHVHSYKKEYDKFSSIPAGDYIDTCLTLDQITTDIRATNRNYAFPIWVILDGEFYNGDKQIGGILQARTLKQDGNEDVEIKQAQIMDFQINNGLESAFTEERNAIDYLYDTVGLTSPTLMQKVGSSDSSKVYQQVNSRMERKIELYIDNIIEAFRILFEISLKENNLYEEKFDCELSFKKPTHIIKNSPYDKALYEQLLLISGQKSLREVARENNNSEEEIDRREQEINNEQMLGNNDISVSKQVQSVVKNANNTKDIK